MASRWIKIAILMGAFALCWLGARQTWQTHGTAWSRERLSYECPGGADAKQMAALRRQIGSGGRGSVTGWFQTSDAMVTLEDESASARADVIYLDGDARPVYNPGMVSGQLPGAQDDNGCAIDHLTALALFGSTDVVGQTIEVNGRPMEIRGVFASADAMQGLAMCSARRLNEEEQRYTNMEFLLWPEGGKTAEEYARSLLNEAGIGASGSFNDHTDEFKLLSWSVGVPMALLRFAILFELLRALYRYAKRRLNEKAGIPLTAAFWAGIFALAALLPGPGYPPISMLPSRWSDFAFWPSLLKSWRDAFFGLLTQATPRLRLMELISMATIIGYVLAAVLLSLCLWRILRKQINDQLVLRRMTHETIANPVAVTDDFPRGVARLRERRGRLRRGLAVAAGWLFFAQRDVPDTRRWIRRSREG